MFETCITYYNDRASESRRFKIGNVTVSSSGDVAKAIDYDTVLNVLTNNTVGSDIGGYIYITHGADGTDPIPTIHWIADFEKISAQKIEFGVNLKNYTKTVKTEDVATVIIPLGADVEDDTGESYKLTIALVNDGVDYLYNEDAVAMYGWIYKTVEFPDIANAYELKEKAEEYIKN